MFYGERDGVIWVRDLEDVMFRAAELPPDTDVHVISHGFRDASSFDSILAFYGRAGDVRLHLVLPEELTNDYLFGLSHTRHHAFFLEPENTTAVERLQASFLLSEPQYSSHNIPRAKQFVMYLVLKVLNNSGSCSP